ncbi:MAG: phosphoenolpyruvate carboxylase [Deltaproteobacteria bacterium]|nr:phosphoenolpyruvate carboxylase [Deltaproteobacteria bacterium]
MRSLISQLDVRPVLTAHPTEATRHTILALEDRIARALLRRDRARPTRARAIEAEIEAEVERVGIRFLTSHRIRAWGG